MEKKNSKKINKNFNVDLIFRHATDAIIQEFLNENLMKYEFPNYLTNIERAYLHQCARAKGLKTKSSGKGDARFLTLYKMPQKPNDSVILNMSQNTQEKMDEFLKSHPLTKEETKELMSPLVRNKKINFDCSLVPNANNSRYKLPIPPITSNSNLYSQRINLPVFKFRQQILDVIDANQVTVISAETGAGKSTQIPQYILEDHAVRRKCCKIFCTQPRRVAAIAISQRVAQERNEKLGISVGYQIRLESQMSPMSNLIYTTNGYFLRCLVGSNINIFFNGVTHIILDEIHERDKYSDFLLIAIKEHLFKHPKTKIILMSATIDSNIFSEYFGGCPVIDLPGRMFSVTVYHLQELLEMIKYNVDQKEETNGKASTKKTISDRFLARYVNEVLENCWCSDYSSTFDQFYYLVSGEDVPIDIPHTDTNLNALMIAAAKGLSDVVDILLEMGADPTIIGGNNMNALQWATEMNQSDCVAIINKKMQADKKTNTGNASILLKKYESTTDINNQIDHVLLSTIIAHIHMYMPEGSVLVFLPGYDDILEQKEILVNVFNQANLSHTIELYMLHSSMQINDQRKVFLPVTNGHRKIILSTNIAETSITIDDVIYVVDCGKVKQKSFDPLTGSTSLTTMWISKACTTQRTGRAGRTKPGICFRLFSKEQYNSMDEFTLPEILRVPLPEICLHAKIISINTSIVEFLNCAIQPPPNVNIQQSIRLLQTIGALDANENITELGMCLIDLPLDVQLGKALLYSVFLKCFDPILTIVSILSVKDPFILSGLVDKANITITRKSLSEDTLSDHMVFLKLFKSWMDAKTRGQELNFCRSAGVSNGTMELICGTRSHILGCLRSHKIANNSLTEINTNSDNWSLVKACLTCGLYPNICWINKKKGHFKTRYEKYLLPHSSAAIRDYNIKRMKDSLLNHPDEWLVYCEKTRNDTLCLVRHNTTISSLYVALFCGPYYMPDTCITTIESETSDSDEDNEYDDNKQSIVKYSVDDWIEFAIDADAANILRNFRHKLNVSFFRMLRYISMHPKPQKLSNINDSSIIQTIKSILRAEDDAAGLLQPACVGYRPVAVKLCFGSDFNFGIPENVNAVLPTSNHVTKVVYSTSTEKRKNFPHNSYYRNLKKDNYFIEKSKFFIINATRKDDIYDALRKSQWNFSTVLLEKLLQHRKKSNEMRLVLFFCALPIQSICGVGELLGTTQRNFGICSMSHYEVPLKEKRIELPYSIQNLANLLSTYNDGDEIQDKIKVKYLLEIMLK